MDEDFETGLADPYLEVVVDSVRESVVDALSTADIQVFLSDEQVSDIASAVGSAVSESLDYSAVAVLQEGELVPSEGQLILHTIEQLFSYFQEDDNQILSDIRSSTNALKTSVQSIQQSVSVHPFLTTNFSDYTVTEGLLLLIILFMFIKSCVRIIKEGFSWLN